MARPSGTGSRADASSPTVSTEGFDPARLEFRPDHDGEFDELVATFEDGGVFIETMSDQGVYIDFQWDDGLHCQLWITCGGKAKLRYYHEADHGAPPRFTAKGVDTKPHLPRPVIDVPRPASALSDGGDA